MARAEKLAGDRVSGRFNADEPLLPVGCVLAATAKFSPAAMRPEAAGAGPSPSGAPGRKAPVRPARHGGWAGRQRTTVGEQVQVDQRLRRRVRDPPGAKMVYERAVAIDAQGCWFIGAQPITTREVQKRGDRSAAGTVESSASRGEAAHQPGGRRPAASIEGVRMVVRGCAPRSANHLIPVFGNLFPSAKWPGAGGLYPQAEKGGGADRFHH